MTLIGEGGYIGYSKSYPYTPLIKDSLVLHIDAGDKSSYSGTGVTWYDLSDSKNNLTITGSPSFDPSIGYFTFNGSSQYARTLTLPAGATNFTMSAWISPASLSQLGLALTNGRDDGTGTVNGYALGVGSGAGAAGGKLQALVSAVAWVDPGYTFPIVNDWYHITVSRDTSTFRYYVNGIEYTNSAASPVAPTQNFVVGAAYGAAGARYFNGKIASVVVYSKRLLLADIKYNFNSERGRFGI